MTFKILCDALKKPFESLKEIARVESKPYVAEVTTSHLLGIDDPVLSDLAGKHFKPFTKSFATKEARADFLRQYQTPSSKSGLYQVVDRVEGNKTIVGVSLTPRDPDFIYQLYSFNKRTY